MPIFFDVIFPVVVLIALGYGGARLGPLDAAAVRALSDTTFQIFMPGLLFGALARVDFASLSPGAALAYYASAMPLFAAVLLVQRGRGVTMNTAVVQSLGAVYANTVALGIPLVKLAFGEEGLAFLLTIVALHSLIFLTLGTLLIELAAGSAMPAGADRSQLGARLSRVVRSSLIHPVVLPILVGLAWSAAGLSLPRFIAVPIGMLGAAAAPLCLVLLGASLAQLDLRRGVQGAIALTALKSLVHPLLVWSIGRFLLDLPPLPLAVATVTAALPMGANVYLFAQRYDADVAQTSAGTMLSTLVVAISIPWLLIVLPGS